MHIHTRAALKYDVPSEGRVLLVSDRAASGEDRGKDR